MPELIEERHRAAGKAARRAKRTGAATDYHRLRIRCKRLRYALEFASGLYDGELKGFVRQMTRLQDALGSMQDAAVASSRLQVIALTEEGASLSRAAIFAMGGVAGQYRSEAEHLLGDMPAARAAAQGQGMEAREVVDGTAPEGGGASCSPADRLRAPKPGRSGSWVAPARHLRMPASRLPRHLTARGSRLRPSPGPERARSGVPRDRHESAPVTARGRCRRPTGWRSPGGAASGRTARRVTPIRRQVAPS